MFLTLISKLFSSKSSSGTSSLMLAALIVNNNLWLVVLSLHFQQGLLPLSLPMLLLWQLQLLLVSSLAWMLFSCFLFRNTYLETALCKSVWFLSFSVSSSLPYVRHFLTPYNSHWRMISPLLAPNYIIYSIYLAW